MKGTDDLYATKVTLAEILYVVKKMTRLHESGEKPDFESATFIIADRYRGKRDAVAKTFAIMERMLCLSKLMERKDERMRGWTIDAIEEGCMLTNEAVFTATALCPLKKNGERICFEPDDFFEIVLRESESEGRA
jgi:hypothetical protein